MERVSKWWLRVATSHCVESKDGREIARPSHRSGRAP